MTQLEELLKLQRELKDLLLAQQNLLTAVPYGRRAADAAREEEK